MKLTYDTTATLDDAQLFEIIREYVETRAGKRLCNIYWDTSDAGVIAKLLFVQETVQLNKVMEK